MMNERSREGVGWTRGRSTKSRGIVQACMIPLREKKRDALHRIPQRTSPDACATEKRSLDPATERCTPAMVADVSRELYGDRHGTEPFPCVGTGMGTGSERARQDARACVCGLSRTPRGEISNHLFSAAPRRLPTSPNRYGIGFTGF